MPKVSAASVLGSATPHLLIINVGVTCSMKVFILSFYFNQFCAALIHLTEYQRIKAKVTDEGGEKHVYDVTGCKSGCTIKKYAATVKEKMRFRNRSATSDNQVCLE